MSEIIHVRVFDLDLTNHKTKGEYVSPSGVTLDAYLEAEGERGFDLEDLESLPIHPNRNVYLLRVVTCKSS